MAASDGDETEYLQSAAAPKSTDFVGAIKGAFSKFATFKGRASRSEFWYFALYYFSILAIVLIGDADTTGTIGIVALIVLLASVFPFFSVMVRRLHDTGKSGWWYWVSVIPLGGIVVIVFLSQEGDSNDNVYGPSQVSE